MEDLLWTVLARQNGPGEPPRPVVVQGDALDEVVRDERPLAHLELEGYERPPEIVPG